MMEPRTYKAATMAMALGEIKRDLGPSAVILRTRRLREGAMLGLIGGHLMWEIQAAAGEIAPLSMRTNVAQPTDVCQQAGIYTSDASGERADGDRASGGRDEQWVLPQGRDIPVETAGELSGEAPGLDRSGLASTMAEVHRMVGTLLSRRDGPNTDLLPTELAALKQSLLDQDVAPEIVDELIDQLQASTIRSEPLDEQVLGSRTLDLISKRLRVDRGQCRPAQAGRGVTVCLIGPTGVGKTTTIAKLAANYKLREHRSVGLITIDNYRIAAVDQLRTYAEIIEVPIQAVLTPGELHRAVHAMSDLDVVLIDTAGRSQNDEMRLNELRRFIEAADCDEVHLVVSAAASRRVADAAVSKFSTLGANRIIVTKLDEAATFGMILNVAAATDAAISYVTTGQGVPDDIAPADADVLANCIVRGSWNAS